MAPRTVKNVMIQFMPLAIGTCVGALNKNLKGKEAKEKGRSADDWYKENQEDETNERDEKIKEVCAGDESESPRQSFGRGLSLLAT